MPDDPITLVVSRGPRMCRSDLVGLQREEAWSD
jgi:hypothetical protein